MIVRMLPAPRQATVMVTSETAKVLTLERKTFDRMVYTKSKLQFSYLCCFIKPNQQLLFFLKVQNENVKSY